MVARLNHEIFTGGSYTPQSDPTDSEGVLMALETAHTLETQGEMRETARWLRRAADEAAKDGNDERVLVLARAAADLTNAIESAPEVAGAAPAPSPTAGIGPMLAALISSIPPFSPRPYTRPTAPAAVSSVPTIPPPDSSLPTMPPSDCSEPTIPAPSSLPTTPPPASYVSELSTPANKPLTERTMRMGAIRVAITGSIRDAKSFHVERLEAGQRSPAGTMEAMLVLTGEIEGSLEMTTHLRVVDDATKKPARSA